MSHTRKKIPLFSPDPKALAEFFCAISSSLSLLNVCLNLIVIMNATADMDKCRFEHEAHFIFALVVGQTKHV